MTSTSSDGFRRCHHCGEPAVFERENLAFCCLGCEQAHAWISEAGLVDYYKVRSSLGEDGRQVTKSSATIDYSYLDDPRYLVSLGGQPGRVMVRLSGMHCAACVWLIESLSHVVTGLAQARVDLAAGSVTLWWDPQIVKLSEIARILSTLGYSIQATDEAAAVAARVLRRRELIRMALTGACAGNAMMVAIALYAGEFASMEERYRNLFSWASALLAFPAVTYGAWPFYRAAWNNLKFGRLHLDLPISLGIGTAYLSSWYSLLGDGAILYFDSVAMLVFLLLVGRFIQQRAQQWALSQNAALHLLLPPSARRQLGAGHWEIVPTLSLRVGDLISVRPGDRLPADGRIVTGTSAVDASSLTGESQPVPIGPGETALAGTLNVEHEITMVAQAVGLQTRIGALARQVTQNSGDKSAIESLVDRMSGRFVAAVLGTSVVAAGYWWWIDPSRIFEVVLSILVVTCPCALGMATPLALARARAQAAQHGFVLARANALEDLAKVTTFVFDKTGTLTQGRLDVQQVWSVHPSPALAAIVAAMESHSTHPIGRALMRWTSSFEVMPLELTDVCEKAGEGVFARLGDCSLQLGRCTNSSSRANETAWSSQIVDAQNDGKSVVYLESNGEVIAAFALADQLRPEAHDALQCLRAKRVKLAIFSGDHQNTVNAISRHLPIDLARGDLLPEQKCDALHDHVPCAMVGDGVNDAPALQRATVGIAIGGSAEIAMRVADIYVARQDVWSIVQLLNGARRSLVVIRRNLAFALVYNLVFVSGAFAGHIDPLAAAILMPISSLTVVFSSIWSRPFGLRPRTDRDSSVEPLLAAHWQPSDIAALRS